MGLRDLLSSRIGLREVKKISEACSGSDNEELKSQLYSLIADGDDRVGYNALWVFIHMPDEEQAWLSSRRNELIDLLLESEHTGKRRLLLNILSQQPFDASDIRTDFLDFCLSKINSAESYAIRAQALKLAYKQCCLYPELMGEIRSRMEMMEYEELSPGLLSAYRQIKKKLN